MYGVNEGDGSVNLGISFISGNAGEYVPHMITSTAESDGSANCCVL